jgi:hypothetical protein
LAMKEQRTRVPLQMLVIAVAKTTQRVFKNEISIFDRMLKIR